MKAKLLITTLILSATVIFIATFFPAEIHSLVHGKPIESIKVIRTFNYDRYYAIADSIELLEGNKIKFKNLKGQEIIIAGNWAILPK